MTYDLYDYFKKNQNNPVLTEITEKVRQNIWRETTDVVTSQTWLTTEEKIRINLYLHLRFN